MKPLTKKQISFIGGWYNFNAKYQFKFVLNTYNLYNFFPAHLLHCINYSFSILFYPPPTLKKCFFLGSPILILFTVRLYIFNLPHSLSIISISQYPNSLWIFYCLLESLPESHKETLLSMLKTYGKNQS